MITFEYTAKRLDNGDTIKAEVQAETVQAASKLLISQQLFPITIVDKNASGISKLDFLNKVKPKERVIFSRQLATLINAGLPLTQSLRTVRGQVNSKPLKAAVDEIVSAVEGGTALSVAFGEHPKIFNSTYCALISAGEATGTLDKSLERIANQQEKDAAIAGKIRSALIYPAVVSVVIVGVVIFMITGVLPQIASLYEGMHLKLPFFTEMLNQLSKFLINYWWIAILIVGAIGYAIRRYFKSPRGISQLDTVKMHAPIFGMIFRKVYMARFARTLGTMLSSGIPMLQGLEIVRNGIGNTHVAATINASIEQVKGGKSLSSTLEGQPTFLPLVPQMVLIGEQSGAIDQLLDRIATYYENEVDEEVANLSTIIEPVMIVVMGGVVGGIIAAILLPVYSLVGSGALSK